MGSGFRSATSICEMPAVPAVDSLSRAFLFDPARSIARQDVFERIAASLPLQRLVFAMEPRGPSEEGSRLSWGSLPL